MIQLFRNIPIKFKLIIAFLLILIINATYGLFNLQVIRDISQLVNVTYDKALMSGNFAQASKFDFSKIDTDFRTALLSRTKEDFDRYLGLVKKSEETLKDDLEVVRERALSTQSSALTQEFYDGMKELNTFRDELIQKKEKLLRQGNQTEASVDLMRDWEQNSIRKKLYRKLNTLNDDAAVVGYKFRLDSEAKNKKNLNLTIIILLSCLILSLVLAIFASFIIIRPLLALQNVCKKVSGGDLTVRTDVKSTDEFGTLGNSFNFMLETIHDKSRNISSLLSALPFGLFYFDKTGLISKERSDSTDIIFPDFPNYGSLSELYSAHSVPVPQLHDILDSIFSNLLPFRSAADLLPSRLTIGKGDDQRIIRLNYEPKYLKKKKVERVIMLAEDITEMIRSQLKTRELTERVERISIISSDLAGFKEFVPSVEALFDAAVGNLQGLQTNDMNELKRNLHSLKGLLGLYAYHRCAELINETESMMEKNPDNLMMKCEALISKTRNQFHTQTLDVNTILKLDEESDRVYFNEKRVRELKSLANNSNEAALQSAVADLDKFPFAKVFAKYQRHAKETAAKLEDKDVQLILLPSDDVSYEEVMKLDSAFIHLLNNSLDHGLESTQERTAIGKTSTGHVKVACRRSVQSLEFVVSDDGKGIDAERLVEKAIAKELLTVEAAGKLIPQEKFNLVFASGLSSKDSATQISGRGVGLDAVRDLVQSLGGTIHLTSMKGQGTTFTIKVPV